MQSKRIGILLLVVVACPGLVVGLYQLPPVYTRLSRWVDNGAARIRYALNPPGEAVFIPQEQDFLAPTRLIPSHTPSPTDSPSTTGTVTPLPPQETPTLTSTPAPSDTPTSIPAAVALTGAVHEYQQMNNCGPATLSVALTYWGWQGDQRDTRAYLRPNFATVDDKNVSPYEMVNYVNTQTDLEAIARVGGDTGLLKRLVAAGFPVIIEKGFQPPKEDWMGHYELVTGYDETRARFITQDVYIMPDFPVPYQELSDRWWRDFNHVYLVVYPPDYEAALFDILGPQVDSQANYQAAAQNAHLETETLRGRDLFFAWYNLGTNQVSLADYAGAARAYDQAFSIYAALAEEERPWRVLWYQPGPYEAYYRTGRYQDVINLAHQTLSFLGAPILEESLYWRGLAKVALGDREGALEDLTRAVEINPTSTGALAELQRLQSGNP